MHVAARFAHERARALMGLDHGHLMLLAETTIAAAATPNTMEAAYALTQVHNIERTQAQIDGVLDVEELDTELDARGGGGGDPSDPVEINRVASRERASAKRQKLSKAVGGHGCFCRLLCVPPLTNAFCSRRRY
jgi:hypothetical protein